MKPNKKLIMDICKDEHVKGAVILVFDSHAPFIKVEIVRLEGSSYPGLLWGSQAGETASSDTFSICVYF